MQKRNPAHPASSAERFADLLSCAVVLTIRVVGHRPFQLDAGLLVSYRFDQTDRRR
jgi:hypothetical protein